MIAAAALASVRHVRGDHARRAQLFERAETLKRRLDAAGLPVLAVAPATSCRCMSARPRCAREVSRRLLDEFGMYATPINYPTVPRGEERLRLTPTPLHTDAMMDRLVARTEQAILVPARPRLPLERTPDRHCGCNPGQGRRLRAGSPWVFSNEIAMKPEYRQMPPGGLVRLEGDDGARFGTFMFNPHSLIAARLLDRDPAAAIDAAWLRARLREAIALRARVCDTPFHRLVHAEADRLPGLVIDRYDDVAVLQANTAGMDRLTPLIVEALTGLLPLRAVVARNDCRGARAGRAGARSVALLFGDATRTPRWWRAACASRSIRWPGRRPAGSSTSGRTATASRRWPTGARVLDVFCHVGAFGLRCAAAGARDGDAGGQPRTGAGAGRGRRRR